MLSPPAASSDKLWDSSSSSSDAGDVLVRSTRLLEAGHGSVRITVQKLRDAAGHPPLSEQHQQSSGTENQQRTKLQHKPDIAALLWAPADSQPGVCEDRRTLKKPGPTKENREPTGRLLAAKSNPDRKLSAGTQSGQQPGHDLLTSRFAPGGRGVVLAALKQRSHSTPHRREVKVQLLDPGPFQGTTSSQDAPAVRPSSQDVVGVQTDAQVSSGRLGDATNAAAAAAAAAVAAAAPLIKSQSDMEARVSQLADGVERLLQADREVVDRGRGMSQQTLQHLETLHSRQLQLQSQLLESALRIVTSHTTSTTSEPAKIFDLTASGQPACLQVTHLDAAANVLSNQQPSSLATREGTVETGPVSMATPRRDRWPKQTRDDRYRRGSPSFSRATQSADRSQLQSSANNGQARRAKEVLKEMGRLKTEIEMLLTPEDSLNITPAQVPHQTQQNQSQNRQNQCQTHQNPHKTQQNQPQYQQNQSQENQLQIHQIQSRPVLVQRRPVVPSMLEEAGLVLRQVQRQKKVLEENLDSLLRAKTGEVLHCQLEALAANRDWTEEVRIKKTVDAWINTLSKDIQAEMSSEDTVRCRPADAASKHSSSRDPAVTSQQRVAGSRGPAHTGRGRPVNVLRGTGNKKAGRESRGQTAGQRQEVEPVSEGKQVEVDGESYLTHLYGRAPYDGLRRTLKKSPYLRFSSPASPLCRKSRPRLVESVRGVKVKSCKTQTSLAPPVSSSPAQPQSCYIFSSSHLTPGDPSDLTVTPGHSVSMAIPLGRPRMESSSRCPPGERQQEMTSHPAPPPTASVVAMDSKTPELHSQEEEQLDRCEAPPPSSHTVEITERKSEEEDDEEDIFPGTNFLSVAEVVQEEVSVVGEEAVELDGRPSPPPVLYQGPVFPPQACSALPAQEQAFVLCPNPHRDALENRLVEWVEQQLMSRMISQMYRPPPADPVQNDSSDQSELEEHSFTSDIVEAAGGGGLQLFVDASMSVDSALIRQLVNEVLTETVALMLGQREALGSEPRPEPLKPALHQEEKQVPLLPTPVPTPPSSPAQPSRGTTPLTTPPPSEPTSLLNEESPQPITAPELVATPTPSPEPTPSRGTPPAVHQVSSPLTWGDAELPLDEEKPEEYLDTHTQPLVMSVAEVEPPLSTPVLPPSPPPPPPPPVHRSPTPPPAPDPRPASSSSEDSSSSETSSSSSSSNSSSGSVVTAGTDAALKHISEGELLISVNQLAAMTEEEAICSFSSSLQELQDMDFDPPSEGQVRGHDLLLTLLTKMEQGVTHTHRGERPQPEGSWGREEEEEEVSVGEVRDDQTTKPRKLTVNAMAAPCDQTSSPGQMLQSADVSEVSFEATNQGPVTLGELMVEPSGTLTSDLHSNLSLSPPPRLENTQTAGQVVLVRQYDTQTTDQQQGGTRRMDVHLPSIIPVEEEMEESVSAAADSDSSTNDVF